MDQTLDNPKPVRLYCWRMLITPWRWSRWTWVVVVPLMLVAYVLSAVPVTRFASELSFVEFPGAEVFYIPAWTIAGYLPPLEAFLLWEDDVMDVVIGPRAKMGGGYILYIGEIISPVDSPADALDAVDETGK